MAVWDYTNDYSSTLAATYSSGGGTLTVASASGLPTSTRKFILRVDNEYFLCTSYSGTTLTVIGAQGGSAASSHNLGVVITGCWIIPSVLDGIRSDLVQSDVAANLPATAGQKQGNIYLCTDQPEIFQFNGSAWAPFGPVFPLTLPNLSDFTVDPQAGSNATVTDTGAGITVSGTNGQGSSYYKNGPGSTPFNVTALVSGMTGNEDFPQFGIYGVETSTSKRIDFVVQHASEHKWTINLFNSGPSYSSTAKQFPLRESFFGNFYWMRIRDDGTNRSYQISPDGVNFLTIFSHTRSTWAVLDKFGFTVGSSTNFGPAFRLWSWKQG